MEESLPILAPQVQAPSHLAAPRICSVKFRHAGKLFEYDAGDLPLKLQERIIVSFEHSLVVGIVMRPPSLSLANYDESLPKSAIARLSKVVRVMTDADVKQWQSIQNREKEAFKHALKFANTVRLPAKLVCAEMTFSQDKITFYFASEERFDFRPFVRDLSSQFRARIEVRQIGARDAAKIIGGVGSCGRELCCSTWLVDFRPVSIKMAKDQNLALNPQKVSGQCGRLLCCLTYEQDTYAELRRGLPKVGKRVYTPLGEGRIKDVNVLRRKVRVYLQEGYEEFDADQVKPMFNAKGEMLADDEATHLEAGKTDEGGALPKEPRHSTPRESLRSRSSGGARGGSLRSRDSQPAGAQGDKISQAFSHMLQENGPAAPVGEAGREGRGSRGGRRFDNRRPPRSNSNSAEGAAANKNSRRATPQGQSDQPKRANANPGRRPSPGRTPSDNQPRGSSPSTDNSGTPKPPR